MAKPSLGSPWMVTGTADVALALVSITGYGLEQRRERNLARGGARAASIRGPSARSCCAHHWSGVVRTDTQHPRRGRFRALRSSAPTLSRVGRTHGRRLHGSGGVVGRAEDPTIEHRTSSSHRRRRALNAHQWLCSVPGRMDVCRRSQSCGAACERSALSSAGCTDLQQPREAARRRAARRGCQFGSGCGAWTRAYRDAGTLRFRDACSCRRRRNARRPALAVVAQVPVRVAAVPVRLLQREAAAAVRVAGHRVAMGWPQAVVRTRTKAAAAACACPVDRSGVAHVRPTRTEPCARGCSCAVRTRCQAAWRPCARSDSTASRSRSADFASTWKPSTTNRMSNT